jgi:hypothetical protein
MILGLDPKDSWWLVFITLIFVLTFLILEAAFYVFRPEWLIIDDGINTPDIDMWRAFNVSILVSLLFIWVVFITLLHHYHHYGKTSMVDWVTGGKGNRKKPAKSVTQSSSIPTHLRIPMHTYQF